MVAILGVWERKILLSDVKGKGRAGGGRAAVWHDLWQLYDPHTHGQWRGT